MDLETAHVSLQFHLKFNDSELPSPKFTVAKIVSLLSKGGKGFWFTREELSSLNRSQ
jgi:hypothetical protein